MVVVGCQGFSFQLATHHRPREVRETLNCQTVPLTEGAEKKRVTEPTPNGNNGTKNTEKRVSLAVLGLLFLRTLFPAQNAKYRIELHAIREPFKIFVFVFNFSFLNSMPSEEAEQRFLGTGGVLRILMEISFFVNVSFGSEAGISITIANFSSLFFAKWRKRG